MKYRTATVLSEKTLDDAGTEVIKLNIQDPISRILIGYRAKRVASAMTAHLLENVSKIELVDGSDVLFGMDGSELGALNIYDRRINSVMHSQTMGGTSMVAALSIDFGRFLFDPELAFDPKKFDNPMLKITYNRVAFDLECTHNYLTVIAECFDEKPVSPVGFLMSKEHWKKNMSTDTYEYIDLPTDFPIRKMLVRGYYKGYEPWYTVAEARIDEDNEKRIPFVWDIETYHKFRKAMDYPIIEGFHEHADAGGTWGPLYLTPTDYLAISVGSLENNDWYWTSGNERGGKVNIRAGVAGSLGGLIFGWLPLSCVQFPFGDQTDLDDWYDVTLKGNVRLRLKGGLEATIGAGSVVLQQLRRY